MLPLRCSEGHLVKITKNGNYYGICVIVKLSGLAIQNVLVIRQEDNQDALGNPIQFLCKIIYKFYSCNYSYEETELCLCPLHFLQT